MVDMNMEVLKLPLGFIRIVELPMIIIAFASMSSWKIDFSFTPTCEEKAKERLIKYTVSTFKLQNVMIANDSCLGPEPKTVPLFGEGYGSSAGFFIFTGVISLLFVLAMIAVYVFLWEHYASNNNLPLIDFLGTAVLAGFWLIGTICWWGGANGVGYMTKSDSIQTQLTHRDFGCRPDKQISAANKCPVTVDGGYGSLVISIFAGWACVLLFVANCWFVYKETIWFRNRQANPTYIDPQNTAYAAPSAYGPQTPYQR